MNSIDRLDRIGKEELILFPRILVLVMETLLYNRSITRSRVVRLFVILKNRIGRALIRTR